MGAPHTTLDLSCGGMTRSLLCCHAPCALPNGAPCTLSAHCASFNCLSNGTCGAKGGEIRTSDDQCTSGSCLAPSPPNVPEPSCALSAGEVCTTGEQCVTKSCQPGSQKTNICDVE